MRLEVLLFEDFRNHDRRLLTKSNSRPTLVWTGGVEQICGNGGVKEHSTKELRKKKTEIENLEGALQELVRQYQHLKSKVHILPCLLFRIFPRELIWISSHATSATFTLAVDIDQGNFRAWDRCRDELYKECVAALKGGSLLESEDSQEAEEALSGAFLQADKRLISRFILQFLHCVLN
jgi:hypothetical protein